MSSSRFPAEASMATETYAYTASGFRTTRTDSRDPNQNRLYVYSNAGQLLAEYTGNYALAWNRDVIYVNGRALVEVDSSGVHELHDDHLGTPRFVTNGSSGAFEGEQSFGTYGEWLNPSPYVWGYQPLSGYTGHLQTEPNGLIYMKGRYYSPAWHRFLNSNQGVDPNLINQFAYTLGSLLMMTDPTGMDVGGPGGTNGPEYGFSMATPTNPTYGYSKTQYTAAISAVGNVLGKASDGLTAVTAIAYGKASAVLGKANDQIGYLNTAFGFLSFAQNPTDHDNQANVAATFVAGAMTAYAPASLAGPLGLAVAETNQFAPTAISNLFSLVVSMPDYTVSLHAALDQWEPGPSINPNSPDSEDPSPAQDPGPSSGSSGSPSSGTGGEF